MAHDSIPLPSCPTRRGRSRRLVAWLLLVAVAAAALTGRLALGQSDDGLPVSIDLRSFGLGNHARPGSWAPMRMTLLDLGEYDGQARRAELAWSVGDADGDRMLVSREITLNRGLPVTTWLHVPLPFDADRGDVWTVSVRALDDRGRPTRLLGERRFAPNQWVDPLEGVIGGVGQRVSTLPRYALSARFARTSSVPPTLHEPHRLVAGLEPEDLPDRWMGFAMLDTLVWTGGDPSSLTGDAANALVEWVHRGGHLVVVLPTLGMNWNTPRLAELLPEATYDRVEGLVLSDRESAGGLLRHLSRAESLEPALRELDRRRSRGGPPGVEEDADVEGPGEGDASASPVEYPRLTLTVFEPPAGDTWSETNTVPMMEIELPLREGGTARVAPVVQRNIGYGRVTFIGIPVTDVTLNRPGLDLPEPDVFWNRVLGWRADSPTETELQFALDEGALPGGRRGPYDLGRPLAPSINLQKQAGGGLLLAMVVFITYWIVSGPAMYAWLRSRRLQHLSWIGFVGAAALFTGISWAGARMLRADEIRPVHLTVLDHVADGRWQRGFSYLTVALDGYGSRLVKVGGETEAEDEEMKPWHDALLPFSAPGESPQRFPDQRTYRLDTLDPDDIEAPARSTARQFSINWLGPPQRGWRMPGWTDPQDRPRGIYRESRDGRDAAVDLAGRLAHDLPGPLEDVTVFHVTNRRYWTPRGLNRARGDPWLRVYAVRLEDAWQPGAELDLGAIFTHRVDEYVWGSGRYMENKIEAVAKSQAFGWAATRDRFTTSEQRHAFELLGMFDLIPPPRWFEPVSGGEAPDRFARTLGRAWDISGWFTRPGVIITGYVRGSGVVVPTYVEGRRLDVADASSVTLVRWFHPLPVDREPF